MYQENNSLQAMQQLQTGDFHEFYVVQLRHYKFID